MLEGFVPGISGATLSALPASLFLQAFICGNRRGIGVIGVPGFAFPPATALPQSKLYRASMTTPDTR